ncbi:Ubiquitin-protein ligase E3C [Acipenser ruthenus]|uniref:HECT-type E3 ubiquitin transferase n=1 Tax=Acipenser ruthenus TaxID=7906 RepID=A0A444UDS5_ACIRT|nr:Ubiquitin-protein ligase E3C [Acipenser ruthenus]
MLEVFSAEKTYLPVLQDANCVASLIEQVLHYVVHKGYYRTLYILVNHKLPSCLEYCDAPHVPYASALLEHVLKPLHFTYSSCSQGARQYVFAGFMEEFISSPFTDQIFQFFIPALADARCSFPFEPFLRALLGTVSASLLTHVKAPWLLYFVLAVGETHLGSLSEEGLLLYLRTLQTLLPQLPVSVISTSRQEVISDSDDDDEEDGGMKTMSSQEDRKISVQFITEQCIHKLDTKQQTNALLNLVWRDCASEDVFTMMASICHTLMVQHRMMVPKVRSMVPLLQVISRGSPMSPEDSNRLIPLFYLFSSLFSHSLISIHDSEFFGIPTEGQSQSSMMPFTLLELVSLSRCLRDACLGIIQLAYPETKPEHREEYIAAFKSVGVKTNTEIQQRIQAEQKQWIQLFKCTEVIPHGKNYLMTLVTSQLSIPLADDSCFLFV